MQGQLTGQRLGNYRLDSVLGRGGMGMVYRAEQISLNRTVAVKVIAPELSQDPMLRERFKREAHLAASLDHPNVLPIYEADEADGLLYIAMRFVQGVDLGQAIRRAGRIAPDHAAALVMQVAGALDAAHSRGLVHRDVKPANVLLTIGTDPMAYLTDFGLTKHVEAVSGPTQSGQFVGTPDYAAPEQIQGHAVTAATDVYALGCVLHEALTGSVPFPRDSNVAKMFAHISEPPPRPSTLAEGITPELDEVVIRALAKDPAARYPSAGDLGRAAAAAAARRDVATAERSVAVGAAALRPSAPATPVPSMPAAPAPSLPSQPTAHLGQEVQVHQVTRRSRGMIAVVALAVVALVAGAGVAAFVLAGGRDNPQRAQAAASSPVQATPTEAAATPATETTPAPSPDNGRLPAVSEDEMAADISSMLRRFYGAQTDGDYAAQRKLLSARYQRKKVDPDYATWVDNQATGTKDFSNAENVTATLVDTDASDGTATIYVRGLDFSDPGSKCTTWKGITWARYERGAWRFDADNEATTSRKLEWQDRPEKLLGVGCL